MGTSQSRDGANILESDEEEPSPRSKHLGLAKTIAQEYGLDVRMSGLSLDDQSLSPAKGKPSVKLYHYVSSKEDGKGHWIVAEKLTQWEFVRENDLEEDDEEEEEDENEEEVEENEADRRFKDGFRRWILVVGKRVRSFVSERLQMRFKDDELRVDFVFQGVWALKFYMKKDYEKFVPEYRNCLFENTYYLEATDSNKTKVFGKDFVNWVKPQEADESVWEDAQDNFAKPPAKDSKGNDPKETYTESAEGRIQSLTIGAFDNSFLVSSSGVEAFRNTPTGLHGKGMSVQFKDDTNVGSPSSKKGMLIRGESNMVVFSPTKENRRATGVRRLDLEAGKTVSEWKFEKDGTPITMRDVTNDSKASQLDACGSTFLGLDDNRLCRWDMRDKQGLVQDIAEPVLRWTEGHQFSRGTNFQCFASTGDGCIAVGSKDGKIRLYSNSSMRQAKTAFPGLGSAITAIDTTFDGKWVLATTDNYLILINTTFKDKDGELKTGFTGRMGNKISAPRLLKLTPIDAYLAGENQKFHNGRFSWVTENRKEEHHLVVSVGKFTVIWDFKRVKDSSHSCYKNSEGLKSCYCYMVVPKEESIVESTFMHDNFNAVSTPEAPLVVATPKKLSSFNV